MMIMMMPLLMVIMMAVVLVLMVHLLPRLALLRQEVGLRQGTQP
jgi:hypothetical protein